MAIETVILNFALLWVAFAIVVFLHEVGHFPERIKFRPGIIPTAAAMKATFAWGGLIVNAILFIFVAYYKPENTLLQYVGLTAWLHFIVYSIIGSFNNEPRRSLRGNFYFFDNNRNKRFDRGDRPINTETFVFDDIDNKYAPVFVTAAILSVIAYQAYYVPILRGIFG